MVDGCLTVLIELGGVLDLYSPQSWLHHVLSYSERSI